MPDNAKEPSMTVEQVIEKLSEIEDKSKMVYMYDETSRSFFSSIKQIQDGPGAVCIL